MADHRDLYYGEDKIQYEVVRKDKARKNAVRKADSKGTGVVKNQPRKVMIKVHPDQRVVATAPVDASNEMIHDAMMKRARWIWQSLQVFAKQQDHVLPKRYVSGETQFYLGRRYVLKVTIDAETNDTMSRTVKLNRGQLKATLTQSDAGLSAEARAVIVKRLIDDWYQSKAKIIFAERLEAVLPKAAWVTDTPDFRLLAMKKQWGSCSTKGNLILNPHLVKGPKECIDYVILHELCHIAEHNHSEHFWRLLTQVMPNWKEVKARLDDMAELYLNE